MSVNVKGGTGRLLGRVSDEFDVLRGVQARAVWD